MLASHRTARCHRPRVVPRPRLPRLSRLGPDRHSSVLHAVQPPKDPTSAIPVEAEAINEDEDLPEYVPDPLLNAGIDDDNVPIDQMDPKRRTTKIIIDLVNAGGYFEEKLEEYREYLDVDLLEKFYKRIEMAEEHEDATAADGLRLIWSRVRAEVERNNATPSMRLLDRLLHYLHPSSGGNYQDRYRRVLSLMQEAFVRAQSDRMDIFEVASMLAGGEEPPSGLYQEFVDRMGFIKEVDDLLGESDGFDRDLKERREVLLRQRTTADETQRMEIERQLADLEKFVEDRKQSMRDVNVILDMARRL